MQRISWIGLFLATLSLKPILCFADEDPKIYAGQSMMTGYKLNDFKDFEKKWKLVTVRYRKDTGEQRFTYANDIAWKALMAGGKFYPTGSVFAKIGLATEEDPSFASSAVPSGARRYQFMVRDAKKYQETDGWGYALFDADGKTFPGNPKTAVMACAACHRVVPDRQYVFSQYMELSPFKKKIPFMKTGMEPRIQFETVNLDALPKAVLAHLPPKTLQVRKLIGEISENLFQGTLDEIRPVLYKEAARMALPALLTDKTGANFSLVLPVDKKTKCSMEQIELLSIIQSSAQPLKSQIYCLQKEK
jgi:hypothetical protein